MITHTVKTVDREINRLKHHIIAMGKGCEWQLAKAVKSFSRMDSRLAEEVVKADQKLNELNRLVEEETAAVLAKRQPVARDLRALISIMKIASEFERIGDYASNIAKRSANLSEQEFHRPVNLILEMAKTCRAMINGAIEAFEEMEMNKAEDVWHRDDVVDRQFARLMVQLRRAAESDKKLVESYADLVFIGRCCERIGDHVTNIAENIFYMQTGKAYPSPAG